MPDLEEIEMALDSDINEYELQYVRGNNNLDMLAGVTIEASV